MGRYRDIYFDVNYGKLYENLPSDEFCSFEFENKFGKISNNFIKRKIATKIDGKDFYDIVTPYGYGGPIITSIINDQNKKDLIEEYSENFRNYCSSNNIVSEFVRFHPILISAHDFNSIYDVTLDRKTFGTNLLLDNPFLEEFSKSSRKKIKKILRDHNITYSFDEHPTTLNDFKEIYYSTMNRKNASDEYYFKDEYFDKMLRLFPNNLITVRIYLDEIVIGMGLYFRYNKFLHTHLSGTLSEYIKYSPAYILKYALVEYGVKNGYSLIHYGGGKTKQEDDSLKEFKERFGQKTQFNFYTGKKIWNTNVYQTLCEINNTSKSENYFPAYRSNEEKKL